MNLKSQNKKITFLDIAWSGINMSILAFIILFIIMDITWEQFSSNLSLPDWKSTLTLSITFLLTIIPSYLLGKKSFTREVNSSGLNKQLFSFSLPKLAILYLITCSSEELLFRVAIQGSILKSLNLPMAIGIVSIIFALMHFRYLKYWQLTLETVWVSIVWGTVYGLTNNLILISLAHFAHNFILSSLEKMGYFQ